MAINEVMFVILGHIIVSSFSVRRNWDRLTEQPKSELYRDFGYIDGLRVMTSLLVLGLHCMLTGGIVPLKNVEYAEQLIENPLAIDYMASMIVSIQVFFAIGGLLLTVIVLDDFERKLHVEARYLRSKVWNRLIRIVPVYFFFLLLSIVGDDFPGVKVGTVGYKSLIQERGLCRKKWWTNVLFVDNLPVFGDDHCSSQGWYLAADLQLFVTTLLILAVILKFPKRAGIILCSCVFLALTIPTGIVYLLELESSQPIRLSDLQFLFMYQPWHNHIYMPGYSNMDSYMAGVVVGYLYHQHKHNKLSLSNSMIYTTLKKLRFPFLAVAYFSTFLFYQYDIPRSSSPTILHSFLYRNAGVLATCITFIECFRNPQPGPFRKFLSSKPMTSLGRLSFSVYVMHVPVTRLVLNWFPPMIELSLRDAIWMWPSIGVVSYLFGFVVYACIEQPVRLLLKHYMLDKRKVA